MKPSCIKQKKYCLIFKIGDQFFSRLCIKISATLFLLRSAEAIWLNDSMNLVAKIATGVKGDSLEFVLCHLLYLTAEGNLSHKIMWLENCTRERGQPRDKGLHYNYLFSIKNILWLLKCTQILEIEIGNVTKYHWKFKVTLNWSSYYAWTITFSKICKIKFLGIFKF